MVALIDSTERIVRWPNGLALPTEAELAEAAGSDAFRAWRTEKSALAIDAQTGRAICADVHETAGVYESLGILRDQMAQILNALGMTATAEFAKLNEIAIAEIKKGREAKGLAPDGEKTARLDPSSGLLSKLIAIAAKKG